MSEPLVELITFTYGSRGMRFDPGFLASSWVHSAAYMLEEVACGKDGKENCLAVLIAQSKDIATVITPDTLSSRLPIFMLVVLLQLAFKASVTSFILSCSCLLLVLT